MYISICIYTSWRVPYFLSISFSSQKWHIMSVKLRHFPLYYTMYEQYITLHLTNQETGGEHWLQNVPRALLNILRPRLNNGNFADDILTAMSWTELFEYWLQFDCNLFLRSVVDVWTLVQVMAWHRTGDKTFPEPMITQFTNAYMHHWKSNLPKLGSLNAEGQTLNIVPYIIEH